MKFIISKNNILIFLSLFLFYPLESISGEKNNCVSIKEIAIEIGYKVSKLRESKFLFVKNGKNIIAELNSKICIVTLVAKISDINSKRMLFLRNWNNNSPEFSGKGTYSKNFIYFEKDIHLSKSSKQLVKLQIKIYEFFVRDFYLSITKIKDAI